MSCRPGPSAAVWLGAFMFFGPGAGSYAQSGPGDDAAVPEVFASAKTWGEVLNPSGDVPAGAFKAVYINTAHPRQIVASETVPDIAVNYAYDDLHGIKSEDFGAYWAGRLSFPEEQSRIIEVSQSWSKARIIIDGAVVYEGGRDARVPFTFSRGEHLVEAEYVNNWHTTTFSVAFNDAAARLSGAQVRQELQDRGLGDVEVHFVGLYDTDAKDLSVRLNVARSARPMILVLSSHESVKWVLNEASRGTVRAIVYGSHSPGTRVSGADPRGVLLLQHAGRIGSFDLKPRCTCSASHYHCESSNSLLTTATVVEELTGAPLTGFYGAYSAETIAIPGRAVTPALKAEVRAAIEEEQRKREQCRRAANPDFDRMFDEAPGSEDACTDLARPACARRELERADQSLNTLYAALLEQVPPGRATQLRTEQRRWIRERDAACRLTPGSTVKSDWIARISEDPGKALCVYGSTLVRLEQLRSSAAAP